MWDAVQQSLVGHFYLKFPPEESVLAPLIRMLCTCCCLSGQADGERPLTSVAYIGGHRVTLWQRVPPSLFFTENRKYATVFPVRLRCFFCNIQEEKKEKLALMQYAWVWKPHVIPLLRGNGEVWEQYSCAFSKLSISGMRCYGLCQNSSCF